MLELEIRRTRGDKVIRFIENCCLHTIGELAGQSLLLEEWQKEFIRDLYTEYYDEKRAAQDREPWVYLYQSSVLGVPRGAGKALALDTAIPTPSGWTTMGELAVGDSVFDEHGQPCRVVAATETSHDRPCYRVRFSDGTSVVADSEHEWPVYRWTASAPLRLLTSRDLHEKALHYRSNGQAEHNYSVPRADALQLSYRSLRLDPYLLGVWLGDGTSASGSVTTADQEVVDEIRRAGYRCEYPPSRGPSGDRGKAATYTVFGLTSELRAMGLLGHKHIPRSYLRASIDQRLALFQGLIDSDGTISERGQISYCSSSEILALGVLELGRSLGLKASLRPKKSSLHHTYPNGKTYHHESITYNVYFGTITSFAVSRLTRKLARQHSGARITRQHVVSADPVPSVPVRCVQVDSDSGLFLVGPGLVPTHNSTLTGALCLAEMAPMPWNTQAPRVLVAAVTRENAMHIWGTAADMVHISHKEGLPLADLFMANRNVIWCDENRGEMHRVSADGKGQFGGNPSFTARDELHAWVAEKHVQLNEALQTALAKRFNSRSVTATTAGHDKETILGRLYDEAKKSEYRTEPRPGCTIVCDVEKRFLMHWYEAPDGMAINDPATWRAAHPASWIDEDAIRAQLNDPAIGEDSFARQWLDKWTRSRNAWFPADTWTRCGPPLEPVVEIPEGAMIYCAVDGGWSDDCTALVWSWQEEEDAPVVARARVWGTREDLDGQFHPDCFVPGGTMDMELVRTYIGKLRERYQVREVAYDPKYFTDTAKRLSDDGFTMVDFPRAGAVYDTAVTEFYRLVKIGGLRHDGDPVFASHIESTAAVQTEGSWKIFKLKQSRKIDACVAAIMSVGRCRVATRKGNTHYAFRSQKKEKSE